MAYAYALDGVEQDVRMVGGSISEARESFSARFGEVAKTGEPEPKAKVRSQARAQGQLMAAMGRRRA